MLIFPFRWGVIAILKNMACMVWVFIVPIKYHIPSPRVSLTMRTDRHSYDGYSNCWKGTVRAGAPCCVWLPIWVIDTYVATKTEGHFVSFQRGMIFVAAPPVCLLVWGDSFWRRHWAFCNGNLAYLLEGRWEAKHIWLSLPMFYKGCAPDSLTWKQLLNMKQRHHFGLSKACLACQLQLHHRIYFRYFELCRREQLAGGREAIMGRYADAPHQPILCLVTVLCDATSEEDGFYRYEGSEEAVVYSTALMLLHPGYVRNMVWCW